MPPTTQTGLLLCVFYALFGFPLFLVVLKGMGELINHNINKVITKFEQKFLKREQPRSIQVNVLYVYAVKMVVFILLVAVKIYTFPKYENPTYIDSLYLCLSRFLQ